ncbi:TetR family transcriptional regulator, partial [Streptomyces regensis]
TRDAVVEYLTQIIWAAIDGLARQHGIRIDPDRPVDANKIVQFNRSDDTDVPTTDDAGEAR